MIVLKACLKVTIMLFENFPSARFLTNPIMALSIETKNESENKYSSFPNISLDNGLSPSVCMIQGIYSCNTGPQTSEIQSRFVYKSRNKYSL